MLGEKKKILLLCIHFSFGKSEICLGPLSDKQRKKHTYQCLVCRGKLWQGVILSCVWIRFEDFEVMFCVCQLPERPGQDLPVQLHPDPAGCSAHTSQDHGHRGNSLHLQGSLLQVSKAVINLNTGRLQQCFEGPALYPFFFYPGAA